MSQQEVIHRSECQQCGTAINLPLLAASGIDPLYDMRVAAYLVPMRYETLKKCLSRHRQLFPPLYRLQGRMHRRIRVLSATEIKTIRALSLRGKSIQRVEVMTMDATVEGLVHMPRTAEPSCVTELPPISQTPEEAAAMASEISELLGEDDEELQTSRRHEPQRGGHRP